MKILALSGSARKNSLNTKMLTLACKELDAQGAHVTMLDWRVIELPIYNGDLEGADAPFVPHLQQVREMFHAADGFLIASPEYNGSITPLLKNTLDWASRSTDTIEGYWPFKGKTAALIATSGGVLGGLRGLVHARQVLGNLGLIVVPEQYAMPQGNKVLAEETLDDPQAARIRGVTASLYNVTRKLGTA